MKKRRENKKVLELIDSKRAIRMFFKTSTNEEHNRNVNESGVQINLNAHEDVENEEIINEHGVVPVVVNEEILNEGLKMK